jgi:hypothetical protein
MINRMLVNTRVTSIFKEICRYEKSIKLLLNRIIFVCLIREIILKIPDIFLQIKQNYSSKKNSLRFCKKITKVFLISEFKNKYF